jgi:hypothetical protein
MSVASASGQRSADHRCFAWAGMAAFAIALTGFCIRGAPWIAGWPSDYLALAGDAHLIALRRPAGALKHVMSEAQLPLPWRLKCH